MKLYKRVSITHGVSVYLTDRGLIDHNFELLWKHVIPKKCFDYTISLPTEWRRTYIGEGCAVLLNDLLNPTDTWCIPAVYNQEETNYRLLESLKALDNFKFIFKDNYFYKIPKNIYTLYHDTSIYNHIDKYIFMKHLILQDLLNVMMVFILELTILDDDSYPIVTIP